MNIPQPAGEVLIALRLKAELEKHFGLYLVTGNDPCFEITHEILNGFLLVEIDAEPYFKEMKNG